jgi:hypothetical protein
VKLEECRPHVGLELNDAPSAALEIPMMGSPVALQREFAARIVGRSTNRCSGHGRDVVCEGSATGE